MTMTARPAALDRDSILARADALSEDFATRAAAVDTGDFGRPGAAKLIKYVATNNAIRAVDIALSLTGNSGLSRHHPLERHHRDVLCSRIHTPQDDMITLSAGRAALGL